MDKYLDELKKYSYNGKNRKVIQEMITINNAYYYLLEFKQKGLDKLIYVNKFNIKEFSAVKWVGAVFGLTNEQFDRILKGEDVKDLVMFTAAVGKESAIKIINEIKKAKILDKGTVAYNINITKRDQIYNFKGSKYFSSDDNLRWRIQIMTAAMWFPFGRLFFGQRVSMKKEKL